MLKESEQKIFLLCGICTAITAAALLVPRFVTNPEGGFAAGASAVMTFLLMLGVALLVSLYLLGMTIKRYRSLSRTARIAGIIPGVFLATALIGLIGYLRYGT